MMKYSLETKILLRIRNYSSKYLQIKAPKPGKQC